MVRLYANASNSVSLNKSGANNTVTFSYEAGNIIESVVLAPHSPIVPTFYGITWDIAAGVAGEVMAYLDGLQTGLTQTIAGTWADNLAVTVTTIGAASTVPASVWSGNIGPALLYNTVKTPAEMLYLSTV